MSINTNYTHLAQTLKHLKNPNVQTGTLLIEVPADVGRAYNGYKRGGVIEGAEKFRKEIMSAFVWLFGIPAFNFIGNKLCEHVLKVPMNIDYSNKKDGLDAIRNSVEYLKNQDSKGLDVSELKKYVGKFKIDDVEKTIKTIKGAKQGVSIASWALNCILMGIALPKLNQYLTRKKLKEEQAQKDYRPKTQSLEEFKEKNKKENLSFKGLSETADWMTYGINTNNRFRLISTDIPMIIGRCATARNKYEALEIGLMDSAAIYFYNFCLPHVEKLSRKLIKTPDISPTAAEFISNLDKETLIEAHKKLNNQTNPTIKSLFNEEIQNEIYKQATNGKFGKINKFVKKEELKEIDESVVKLLRFLEKNNAFKNNEANLYTIKKLIKSTNAKNSAFYALGTIASILGLGVLIPKVAYFITKKITGKDGFIGIEEQSKN